METRKELIAKQIESAMKVKGWTRKQLADQMGRSPSEVTKWLSGKHNFTVELLDLLSHTLDTPITGVRTAELVDGYGPVPNEGSQLNEPAGLYLLPRLSLTADKYKCAVEEAAHEKMSLKMYLEELISRNLSSTKLTLGDFAGLLRNDPFWDDDETIGLIRKSRTSNTIHEL